MRATRRGFLGLVAVILTLAGCPTDTGTPVTITVHLVNPPSGITFSFISLTVSGEGMGTVQGSFTSPQDDLQVVVDQGASRSFEVVATVSASDLSAAREYTASGTVDIGPSEQTVNLTLELSAARYLVPDKLNNRIVQLDDLLGTGWTEVSSTHLSLDPSTYQPDDIDLDIDGKIYIATHVSYLLGGIVRIDNVADATPDLLVENLGITALAIDRARNYLYYIEDVSVDWHLHRIDLSDIGAGPTDVDLGIELTLNNVRGLAVDSDGILYVPDPVNHTVIKFDPSKQEGSRVVDTYPMPVDAAPWDVVVSGAYVYASGPDAAAVSQINRSSGAGVSVGAYPADESNPQAGELFKPQRFVFIGGSTVVVTDEGGSFDFNRIVGFTDMSGGGWTSYGSAPEGTGVGQFRLFDYGP